MNIQTVENVISRRKKKTIMLDELQRFAGIEDYDSFYTAVLKCVVNGLLIPIKTSKTNGRAKLLYKKYRIPNISPKSPEDESMKQLHPMLLKSGIRRKIPRRQSSFAYRKKSCGSKRRLFWWSLKGFVLNRTAQIKS